MKLPDRDKLPIRGEDFSFAMDEARASLFHRAFRDQKNYPPPTIAAFALRGVFQLVDQFETDWKKLLHATQQFEYHRDLSIPMYVIAKTELVDLRYRSSIHWLNFQTTLYDQKTNERVLTAKALLMVHD